MGEKILRLTAEEVERLLSKYSFSKVILFSLDNGD